MLDISNRFKMLDISHIFKMLDISNRFEILDISNRFKIWEIKSSLQSTKGYKGWERVNKGGYDLQKTIQRWPNFDFFRIPHSAWG